LLIYGNWRVCDGLNTRREVTTKAFENKKNAAIAEPSKQAASDCGPEKWQLSIETMKLIVAIIRSRGSFAVGLVTQVTLLFRGELVVALPQPVAPILREILPMIPFFAEVFLILWRKALPALIIAQDVLSFLGTELAPILGAVQGPTGHRQKQQQAKSHRAKISFQHFN